MSSMHNTVIVAHIKKEMDAMSRCLTPSDDLAAADDDDYNNGGGAEYTRGAGDGGRVSGNGGDGSIVIVGGGGGGGGGESDDESNAERDIESQQQRDKEQSGPSPAKCIRLVQVNSCDGVTMLSSSSPTPSPVAVSHAPSSPERHDCSSTMPGDGLFLLHEGTNKDDDSPKRLCLVCGDVASGFHYGVASCEACKAFFKRTIQGNIEYTCPASNDCEINKRRRKACQACRFQKCLRMGMLKEGVRLDRVRGGRQKYRRNLEPHFLSTVSLMTKKPSLEGESRSTVRVQSTENKLLLALSNCEPDPLLANPDPSVPDSEFKLVSTLSDLVDRELVCTISWAKQIPGFTELSLDDQMRLLQSSWVEILTLGLAYRSLPKVGRLRFAPDLVLDLRQARQCQAEEMFAQTIHVVDRLERLVVQREEYLLMKALLLVNSDVRVDDYNGLRRLRDTILLALNDCVSTLRPQAQQHLGGLLLCLPALRQVDGAVRRFWSHVKREAQVPMQKLLVEMLESQLV